MQWTEYGKQRVREFFSENHLLGCKSVQIINRESWDDLREEAFLFGKISFSHIFAKDDKPNTLAVEDAWFVDEDAKEPHPFKLRDIVHSKNDKDVHSKMTVVEIMDDEHVRCHWSDGVGCFHDSVFKVSDLYLIYGPFSTQPEPEEPKMQMKPFDLEAAKRGEKVCTRDGDPVRIICWDARLEYEPEQQSDLTTQLYLIALVDHNGEDIEIYDVNGSYLSRNSVSGCDLMMVEMVTEALLPAVSTIKPITIPKKCHDMKIIPIDMGGGFGTWTVTINDSVEPPIPLGRNNSDEFLDTNLTKMQKHCNKCEKLSNDIMHRWSLNYKADTRIGINDEISPELKSKRLSDW